MMAHNVNHIFSKYLLCIVTMIIFPGYLLSMECNVIRGIANPEILAELYLGEMLATGVGCEKNEEQARSYFEKVDEQQIDKEACVWACLWLGKLLYEGKNEKQAKEYLGRARSYVREIKKLSDLGLLIDFLKESKGELEKKAYVRVFCQASKKINLRIADFLLKYGASVKEEYLGITQLHESAFREAKEEVMSLLESGAAIEAQDCGDKTALHWASQF